MSGYRAFDVGSSASSDPRHRAWNLGEELIPLVKTAFRRTTPKKTVGFCVHECEQCRVRREISSSEKRKINSYGSLLPNLANIPHRGSAPTLTIHSPKTGNNVRKSCWIPEIIKKNAYIPGLREIQRDSMNARPPTLMGHSSRPRVPHH